MIKCTRSSILVHRTLALCFKGGYEHRRIDITMRFGLRRAPSATSSEQTMKIRD